MSGSAVFKAYFERAEREYRDLSSTPTKYREFLAAITKMWEVQPNTQPTELRVRVWIVDGDRDEAIKRSHTEELADLIPDAGLVIQPQVSYFSFLQAPGEFNSSLLHFLEKRRNAQP